MVARRALHGKRASNVSGVPMWMRLVLTASGQSVWLAHGLEPQLALLSG